ncbi:MAG: efflux RND transporter periplasmic adaptor subunit [Hydrogenophilales bacterium]|nr:efflux RND transporter periplasmic adaptor subunit [Hydrogenophilales bacterium]
MPKWSLRLLVLLVVVAGVGFLVWTKTRPADIEVTLATVDRGTVEATIANTRAGTVKPCRRAKLSPQGGGQIARLHVREGDRVQAGQILLTLWNDDLSAQQSLANEQLATARARRAEACAAAAAARRDAERSRQLAAQGFISSAQVDNVASLAEVKAAACRAAETDIGSAQARIAAARAGMARSVLKAPFAGIVAEVTGEQGEYATPSPPGIPTPPAVDLIDDACLYVTAPIDEVDAPAVKLGQPARIALDAFPKQAFPGKVRRIAPYVLDVEKQARTVDVEVEFTDPSQIKHLLVGYSADAEIILERRERVLRVPTQGILEGGRVLRLKDGLLEDVRIETGLANWEFTEVRKGLAAADQIVSAPEKEGVKAGVRAHPPKKP